MPGRFLSRILLSLLMLWQLSASVLAHPIMELSPQTTTPSTEHCHEHSQAVSGSTAGIETPNGLSQATHHHGVSTHSDGCKAGCKCPCAGTPALSFVLFAGVMATPESQTFPAFNAGCESASLANLLRPPI
jgi:hypothetical protein